MTHSAIPYTARVLRQIRWHRRFRMTPNSDRILQPAEWGAFRGLSQMACIKLLKGERQIATLVTPRVPRGARLDGAPASAAFPIGFDNYHVPLDDAAVPRTEFSAMPESLYPILCMAHNGKLVPLARIRCNPRGVPETRVI